MDQIRSIIVQIEWLKQEKKFDDAIKLIQTSITQQSEDYRLFEELADIYLYRNMLPKAYNAVNYALEMNKDSATGNYLKGFILLSQDKPEEAVKFLEKSNSVIWNNSEVLRNLGWAYTLTGEYERGISILKRALNLSPEDELITEDLAMALLWAGELNEWNELLKKIGKKARK